MSVYDVPLGVFRNGFLMLHVLNKFLLIFRRTLRNCCQQVSDVFKSLPPQKKKNVKEACERARKTAGEMAVTTVD